MARTLILVFLIALMAAPLVGCGRRGALEAPPGSDYPRKYPSY